MSKNFDVVIIGAGSTGSYIAKLLSEKGRSVCVVDSLPKEKIGTKYDIFHIEEKEFHSLSIPRPVKGDKAWAFEFSENLTADPKNLYPKRAVMPVVGLHMHEYMTLLNEWAASYGAEFVYEAAFESFTFENGKISGINIKKDGAVQSVSAKAVIDCSGIRAVGRRALPPHYGVETFDLTSDDMFYVILWYVKLLNESDFVSGSCGWPFFKSWIAPCADPEGAIIGIGACEGFEHAEEVFEEMKKHITLPEHEVVKIEKGFTPYTRPPFSFVADNFIVSGDAACLTKPLNGEGVTSSMYQARIAAGVLDEALQNGSAKKADLWKINVEYNKIQGAGFAFLRALLVGIVNAATFDEFEYAFESGMITDELLGGFLSPKKAALTASRFIAGIVSSKISRATVGAALGALKNAIDAQKLYLSFPEDPLDYFEWKNEAEKLWKKIGKIK